MCLAVSGEGGLDGDKITVLEPGAPSGPVRRVVQWHLREEAGETVGCRVRMDTHQWAPCRQAFHPVFHTRRMTELPETENCFSRPKI